MPNIRPHVTIYTDGACSGNPGPGGYGAILVSGSRRKEISSGFTRTTNQRMELMAVIAAMELLKRPSEVKVYTDSKYVRQGITSWIHQWRRRGWKTASKTPVKNRDLWERLSALTEMHRVEWEWVKGHAGHPENERCDQLATGAIRSGNLEHDPGFSGR